MVDRLFADSYLASLYDAWCPRAERTDYDFYLPRIMAADAVLDVGCGTGTLLAEARANGHRGQLCGLDPAAGMLDLARRHGGIAWVQGDMSAISWSAEFDLVVMTGHAFQTILDDAELLAFAQAVRRALRPGGRFAFETRNPAARAWERWRPENAVTVRDPQGDAVRITTEIVTPFDGETVSFTHALAGTHASLPQVSRSTLRFLDGAAVDRLLDQAGFHVEERYGDFDRQPLSGSAAEIVTVARAA